MYWILVIGVMVASYAVQLNLKSKFKKYSEIRTANGETGCQVAQRMLRENGVNDVRITCIDGQLTDHYDPTKKTVNLSHDVYYGNSITSAAVAAHECGHAVQHAAEYAPVKLRSALVPPVQFASNIMSWVILAGLLLINVWPRLLLLGILLYALTTLFSFVTLPVEIDASRRALAWMGGSGVADSQSAPAAQGALRAAAYTYVVAALSSLGTLLYYIMIYRNSR